MHEMYVELVNPVTLKGYGTLCKGTILPCTKRNSRYTYLEVKPRLIARVLTRDTKVMEEREVWL